ncbi:MAG: hypothetical protein JWM88_217 [Verrucomicrobia bacterium]|nr:hypothetical protein [Verrucomicrobiota bacterium]
MDDEFHDLEAELKRLRPVAPSAFVHARIEQALSHPRRRYWGWTALPLAAAVLGLMFVKERAVENVASPAVPSGAAAYKPVSAQNLLYDHQDEGLVTLADGSTARRFRNSYVDTITWKNQRTQASLRWSVPRTEERLVPVTFQ